ncbi:MAG TPA: HAMP domain-containing sensor histidine kinase [Solirubrobacteraceae bacterium]
MSFRRRITIASAAAVAVAVVLASLLVYVLTSNQLHGQIDSQLRDRGREATRLTRYLDHHGGRVIAPGPGGNAFGLALTPSNPATQNRSHSNSTGAHGTARQGSANPFGDLPPAPNQVRGYQQVVGAKGTILIRSARGVSLPVDAHTRLLAANGGVSFFRDAYVGGTHLRILAEPLGSGRAVQFAQPLTEVDSLLSRLRLILVLLDIGGIALAALLGRLVSGAAVQPLKRLTQTTEHVALTQDLSRRIQLAGADELGRLASSFNAMLDALEHSMSALDASVHAQRQLVADASHELRTPVTSLRTNIEILQQQGQELSPEDTSRLLSDVVEQIEELTLLMNDLIELARGEEPRADAEDLRLDLLVSEVLERTRRNSPATPLPVELERTFVTGVPARLERAIANLLDNAIKYSPPGEPVEVRLRDGALTVRDHGPGISAEDLPHIFDRFYRGAEARGRPGSGLGLAIVRQVASQQGGSITAEPAPGGGTLMRLHLPGAEVVAEVDNEGQYATITPGTSPEQDLPAYDRSPA